ncbi:TolC family protein [Pseudomonas aeruginosa]
MNLRHPLVLAVAGTRCVAPSRRGAKLLYLPKAALVLASLFATLPSWAQDAPGYSLLLKQSLEHAPSLREQAAEVSAAQGTAQQARAWRNPSVDVLAENLNAPLVDGASQRQTTYSITQPLELFGQRGARVDAGERGLDAAQARQHQAEVDFAAELAVTYAAAEAAAARQRIAHDDVERAEEDLRAAKAMVEAGKEASLRQAQAQAGLGAAQAVAATADAEAAIALQSLSVLVGADEPYTGLGAGLLYDDAATAHVEPGASPAVAAAEADLAAAYAETRIEQKKHWPEIGLTAGRRDYDAGGNGLVVGVTATIPLFDRNTGAARAARARADAANARLDTARLQANAARQGALVEVNASRARLDAALAGEQAATEAYRMGRLGYEAGRTSLVELLMTRRALTDARMAVIDARLFRIKALATLAQANGRIAFGDHE